MVDGERSNGRWAAKRFVACPQTDWRGNQFYIRKMSDGIKQRIKLGGRGLLIQSCFLQAVYARTLDLSSKRSDYSYLPQQEYD
jgi:hypothetical protein